MPLIMNYNGLINEPMATFFVSNFRDCANVPEVRDWWSSSTSFPGSLRQAIQNSGQRVHALSAILSCLPQRPWERGWDFLACYQPWPSCSKPIINSNPRLYTNPGLNLARQKSCTELYVEEGESLSQNWKLFLQFL